MAQFIGATIRIVLKDQRQLQGVLTSINADLGTLILEDVTLTTPQGRVAHITAQSVSRDTVDSLQMVSHEKEPIQRLQPTSSSETTTKRKPKAKTKGKQRLHTQGSEADDSAMGLEESSPNPKSRKGSSSARRKASNATVTPPIKAEFTEDFDFAQGLKAFDKQAIWKEIAIGDKTDPASRLVAHNKRGNVDKFNTKLAFNENVLDDTEQSEAVQAVKASKLLVPPAPAGDAFTAESETEVDTEDDLAANGARDFLSRPVLTARTNLHCPLVPWKEWKDVLQLANIELGPNLVQRIENAARGIAGHALSRLPKSTGRTPSVAVLCGTGTKGQVGLRTGAHLINKGVGVTALLIAGDSLPGSLEFQLRLYSAAGGKLVRVVADLPHTTDLIIDALADNEPQDSKIKRKASMHDGEAALYANSNVAPTVSIDLPSGIDPDTGHVMNAWSIVPQETVALACLKKAHAFEKTVGRASIVDLGLPHAAFERASTVSWPRGLFGQEWLVETVRAAR